MCRKERIRQIFLPPGWLEAGKLSNLLHKTGLAWKPGSSQRAPARGEPP